MTFRFQNLFIHMMCSKSFHGNPIKNRLCKYRKYSDIGGTGDISNSSKLQNIDNIYIRARLWVWGNDWRTSLTCVRARLWVSRHYLHTSIRCIKAWVWMLRNYSNGSLTCIRSQLWVPGNHSHLLYLLDRLYLLYLHCRYLIRFSGILSERIICNFIVMSYINMYFSSSDNFGL